MLSPAARALLERVVDHCKDFEALDDDQLLARAAADPDAMEALYRRNVGKTVAFAVHRCETPEEIHDLVAAIWLEVIAAVESFNPNRGRALAWIYGVGANLAADRRRRAAREAEALRRLGGQRVLDESDIDRLEGALDARRESEDALVLLQTLPPGEPKALELVARDGLSSEEAAEVLGIDPSALRMRIARARKKLRGGNPDAMEVRSC